VRIKAIVFTLLTLGLLASCANLPNSISVNKSDFDGQTEISMIPATVYSPDSMWEGYGLGLRWRSDMGDSVVFTAEIGMDIVNIKSKGGLQINIDGNVISLDSPDIGTNFESQTTNTVTISSSKKEFLGTLALVRRMLSAKSVMVRLKTQNGYEDADFKMDGPMVAKDGFAKFIHKVDEIKGTP